MITERIHFRFIIMPCCHHNLCWANPRLPSHCPECGMLVAGQLRLNPQLIRISDADALLKYRP